MSWIFSFLFDNGGNGNVFISMAGSGLMTDPNPELVEQCRERLQFL